MNQLPGQMWEVRIADDDGGRRRFSLRYRSAPGAASCRLIGRIAQDARVWRWWVGWDGETEEGAAGSLARASLQAGHAFGLMVARRGAPA